MTRTTCCRFLSRDRQNLVSNEIQRFNEELTAARTRRIELTARLEHLRETTRGDPENAFASSLVENETIRELRDAIRAKRAETSRLASRYGESHPSMRERSAELDELRGQLQREVSGLVEAAEIDLAEARSVEAGLSRALARAHEDGLEVNLKEIEFRQLDRDQKNKAQLYELVLQRTAETDLTRMFRVTHVRILDRALPPTEHVSPQETTIIVSGTLLGVALGLLLAFMLAYTDSRVANAEAVEAMGLTILGVLPALPGTAESNAGRARRKRAEARENVDNAVVPSRDLQVHTQPRSMMAESCRALRTNLAFLSADHSLESLLVTSPMPSEGKTTVAISLGIAFAQTGRRVSSCGLRPTTSTHSSIVWPEIWHRFDVGVGRGTTVGRSDSGNGRAGSSYPSFGAHSSQPGRTLSHGRAQVASCSRARRVRPGDLR